MLLRIIEIGLLVLILLVFFFQILIPVIRQTPLFPIFRAENKLNKSLAEAHQKIVEKRIKKDIDTIKEKEGV